MMSEQQGIEIKSLSYEDAYQELEQILVALETGDQPLEESLSLYERGALLAAHCSSMLDTAELRVREWQPTGDTTPFDGWQES